MADEDLQIRKAQAFTATLIYCPVCTTNDETEDVHGEVFSCNNCDTEFTFLQVPLEDRPSVATFTGAIIFCPRCCTSTDASSWGLNVKQCSDCDTEYAVLLDPDVVAEYSRYG